MTAAQDAMVQVFGADYVSLHVTKSNWGAFILYTKILWYNIHDLDFWRQRIIRMERMHMI